MKSESPKDSHSVSLWLSLYLLFIYFCSLSLTNMFYSLAVSCTYQITGRNKHPHIRQEKEEKKNILPGVALCEDFRQKLWLEATTFSMEFISTIGGQSMSSEPLSSLSSLPPSITVFSESVKESVNKIHMSFLYSTLNLVNVMNTWIMVTAHFLLQDGTEVTPTW